MKWTFRYVDLVTPGTTFKTLIIFGTMSATCSKLETIRINKYQVTHSCNHHYNVGNVSKIGTVSIEQFWLYTIRYILKKKKIDSIDLRSPSLLTRTCNSQCINIYSFPQSFQEIWQYWLWYLVFLQSLDLLDVSILMWFWVMGTYVFWEGSMMYTSLWSSGVKPLFTRSVFLCLNVSVTSILATSRRNIGRA